ncbi:hypothetical protein BDV96DRAFT_92746 [Lophiotrema nucula]|uniref:Uncharacterized protein n=1 Tax=Lophiotrema nucula TaxID=690887 RepID=A0A6A5Z8M7_9PLEO|nr:hypothetical protein BDV96DRAFT_92746 [Lophiotrema nucula]
MSGVLNSLSGIAGNLGSKFMSILDKILPPEKRAEIVAKLQQFAINNPKLAAFLTTQIVLTGFPLLLFITFTVTVFLFSLIVALIIGLLAAVLFTIFMIGVALIVVLPTIFMTIFTASFLFLWGLGGYYLLKWFNDGDAPAPEGTAIGDKINSLSGGRLSWLTDGAKKKVDDAHTGVDQTPKTHGNDENGSAKSTGKSSGTDNQKKEQKEHKENGTPTKTTDGVQKRAAKPAEDTKNAASTPKKAVSGGTGQG